MKSKIFYIQSLTVCIYFIAYIIKTFVLWEFTNPFWWIINLPNYTTETRGIILFFWFMYYIIISVLVSGLYNENIKGGKNGN